ncbi:diaminopimelate decarboxylase [Besnoitia besnoiti]|uniref:Diaminopimelate decarboxylase n=1 Tax=Besnoitia besnoiti TaxID=94643 RepID=A0A2A9ME78_BESBE|nr:diaminopimelate decarboxylase [Besnoitia besnoiti]PFH36295.1 diaminopimelate decarboxylase [Besnoitia besnoiti]
MASAPASTAKALLFSPEEIRELALRVPTPFHVYDAETIRRRCTDLSTAFSWVKERSGFFRNFFAVKALPNPHVLALLAQLPSMGVDCSSLPELVLSAAAGFEGERIFFTSNNTPLEEFREAKRLGAVINLDDLSHLFFLEERLGLPAVLAFRFNPGKSRQGSVFIGEPEDAKYGLTEGQILQGLKYAKEKGVTRFFLHTMVASNCLDSAELVKTAAMMFSLAVKVKQELDIDIELLNLGGGFGIPYRPEQAPLNLTDISAGIRDAYETTLEANGLGKTKVAFECGRFITGPAGQLITRVIHQKKTYKNYIGVDACMADLMRPGMYGAYHHITVVADRDAERADLPTARNLFADADAADGLQKGVYDVVGGLCENNDKFAIGRELGEVHIGDLLVIHDTGAHGHCMGFNYNGKLRSAEFLRTGAGSYKEIRRREALSDLFATLDFPALTALLREADEKANGERPPKRSRGHD